VLGVPHLRVEADRGRDGGEAGVQGGGWGRGVRCGGAANHDDDQHQHDDEHDLRVGVLHGHGADLHDVDNRYSWAGRCTMATSVYCQPDTAAAAACATQTGGAFGCGECGGGEGTCDVDPFAVGAITTVWDWVNQVNAASYAGYTDWRLATSAGCCGAPTGEPSELESIVDLGSSPTIDPIFGPTVASIYWSASTFSSNPDGAWFVSFLDGSVDVVVNKGNGLWVRAVRPGS
jgi:Protein of unknown function (DUF1566)